MESLIDLLQHNMLKGIIEFGFVFEMPQRLRILCCCSLGKRLSVDSTTPTHLLKVKTLLHKLDLNFTA